MTLKSTVAVTLLGVLITLVCWPVFMEESRLIITTRGIDELGIKLEHPYGERSLQHAVLTNDGPHYLLACSLVFEVTTKDGRVLSSEKVVYDADPLLEKDITKRKALLKKNPGIAPNTRWLIGIGDDTGLEPITTTPPPFSEQSIVHKLFPDMQNYTHFSITLAGAVTETGEAFGPRAREFQAALNEKWLKEYLNDR